MTFLNMSRLIAPLCVLSLLAMTLSAHQNWSPWLVVMFGLAGLALMTWAVFRKKPDLSQVSPTPPVLADWGDDVRLSDVRSSAAMARSDMPDIGGAGD